MVGLSRWCEFGVAGGADILGVACPTLGLGLSTLVDDERCYVSSFRVVMRD
jgi:hypothetical protein